MVRIRSFKSKWRKLPNKNLDAYLVFPEGEDGKKFLVYENFKVTIWNRSLFWNISWLFLI